MGSYPEDDKLDQYSQKDKELMVQLAASLQQKLVQFGIDKNYSELQTATNPKLSFDERYQASYKLVKDLENSLAKALEDPDKTERFLARQRLFARHAHRPLEMVVNKIQNDPQLRGIALSLQAMYEKYPDENRVLFNQKGILSDIIKEISPAIAAEKPSKNR